LFLDTMAGLGGESAAMKRVLLLLVFLAVLAAGTATYLFLRHSAENPGAQFVPGSTIFYATMPDALRTGMRWPKTALAQIGGEPEVSEFFKKPLGLMNKQGGNEAIDLLMKVKPIRFFVALTAVSQTEGDVVIGFQYLGGRPQLDAAMQRLYREIQKQHPDAKPVTADYQGDAITTLQGATPTIVSATHGSWGFISFNEATLKQVLDRASGRDHSPSLAATPNFRTVTARLSKDPDFLWYAQPQPIVDLLLQIGRQQDAQVNHKQLEEFKKIQALGGSLLLDGENQKEIAFALCPGVQKFPTVDHAPMSLTAIDTMLYYEAISDWRTLVSGDYLQSLPPQAQAALTNAGIDLKQIPEIFGDDMGVMASWPQTSMVPNVLVTIGVKDRSRVQTLAQSVLNLAGTQATVTDRDGARVYSFPPTKIPLISPEMAITDHFVIASLTGPELDRALAAKSGGSTLEQSDSFKPAMPEYQKANQAFGYLDSKSLFERVYNTVRPIAIFAAAMTPSIGTFVDVQKLPPTETISRHLSPIVYTNRQTDDGFLVSSSGPITLSQAIVLLAAGGGAAAEMHQ
jgi:hypothetical protein